MLILSVVLVSAALVLMVLGFLLWKKERISLLHEYHYQNVSKENKSKFCALSGQALILMGTGLLISAVMIVYTKTLLWFSAFGISFLIGLSLFIHGESKYNRKN